MSGNIYNFNEQLAMSHGVGAESIPDILLAKIPTAVKVCQATEKEDRSGTDWWVELKSGNKISVDTKVRKEDYAKKNRDDLALEVWSVVEKEIVGWTRDPAKRTDYILWYWKDTKRWCLIPFPMLCKVYQDNWQSWAYRYGTSRQFTPRAVGGYHSMCTFVPRVVVWREIYRVFGGTPAAPAA